MSDEIAFDLRMNAVVVGASGPLAKGSPMVYDSSIGKWKLSSLENRTAANARTQAFALDALGTALIGVVGYVQAGMLPAALSGIGTGAGGQLVKVTDAGALARVVSYTAGDDVIGYCEADGRVHLHIGLPWDMIAALATSITGRKVVYGAGALAGADNFRISTDGNPTHGDAPATTGDDRFSAGGVVYVKGGGDDSPDRCVWQHQYSPTWPGAATPQENLFVGSASLDTGDVQVPLDTFDGLRLRSNLICEFRTLAGGGYFGAWDAGALALAPNSRGFYCGRNFFLYGGGAIDLEGEDVFHGGAGLALIGAMVTAPTAAPNGGIYLRSKPETYEPQYLLPGDNPSTGWRDFGSGASETTVNVTSATPGDITITSATRVVNCDATDMVIRGFTKPTSPAAGVISITNSNASPITVEIGNPVTTGNGVLAPVSPGTTLSIPTDAALTLSYDYNSAEWVAHYGVTVNVP